MTIEICQGKEIEQQVANESVNLEGEEGKLQFGRFGARKLSPFTARREAINL